MAGKHKKKVRIAVVTVIVLVILGQYLFWPYASRVNDFSIDPRAFKVKEDFLHAPHAVDTTEVHPNIIILVADDLGKTDISLYGNALSQTPNIDSLAHEGVKFTNGYVTAAICSPSRAGLLTGRYQQRFGHELQPVERYPRNRFESFLANRIIDRQQLEFSDNTQTPTPESVSRQGLPLEELTLADVLKKNGYTTGIVGKWHLGADKAHQPLQRGFDYHYGFYQAFAWYIDTTRHDIVNVRHKGIMDSHVWDHGHEGKALVRRDNEIIEERDYLTGKLAEEAVNFVDKNKKKPFFLYVPFNAPHTPFQAWKHDVEKFEARGIDRNHAIYYAMIQYLDNAVGAIHQKIKSVGLEENTLIFFISDNGGATYTDATANSPLKGGKLSLYEGGINVPFVAKWKGHIPAGTVYDHPVSSLDIFATAAAESNSRLPEGRQYDGVNLIPFVAKSDTTRPHALLFWRAGFNKAVRKGSWKLVVNQKDGLTNLYNLESDREEKNNVATAFPEKVKELQEALSHWEKELIQPLWPGTGFYKNEFDGVVDRFTL